jgi:hypothetical protein
MNQHHPSRHPARDIRCRTANRDAFQRNLCHTRMRMSCQTPVIRRGPTNGTLQVKSGAHRQEALMSSAVLYLDGRLFAFKQLVRAAKPASLSNVMAV